MNYFEEKIISTDNNIFNKSLYNDLKNKVNKRLLINNIPTKEEEYLIEKYNEFNLFKNLYSSNDYKYSDKFIELFKKDYEKFYKIYDKFLINIKNKDEYFRGKYWDYIYATSFDYTQWEFVMMFKEDFEILKISEQEKINKYENLIKDLDNIEENFCKICNNIKYTKIHKDDKYLNKDITPYDFRDTSIYLDVDVDEYYIILDNINNFIELKNNVIKRVLYDDKLEITELEKYLMEKYNNFSTVNDLNTFLNLFKNDYNSHPIYKNSNFVKLDKYLKYLWEYYFEYNDNIYRKWEFIMIFQYILND
jgi:hypothetical protein